jgi:DNA repair exonuclease SbcCD nuclease subunit
MRIAHLSDPHLGFRAGHRYTAAGINQREQDVADVLSATFESLIPRAPDLILVAGDVFDASRPPNFALLTAQAQLARLEKALPETPVVIIAGNHDLGRTTEVGCALPLFQSRLVHVVTNEPTRLRGLLPGLTVLAVPEVVAHRAKLEPDPASDLSLLLLHGEIRGVIPRTSSTAAIDSERIAHAGFAYAALGHYHVTTEVAPRTWYSGSIEYTSSDPWGELREEKARGLEGKGFLEVDLATGDITRVPIAAARPFIDLPPIDAEGLSPSEVDAAIERSAGSVDLTRAIVRQVVLNLSRECHAELSRSLRNEIRRRCQEYTVDARRPPAQTPRLFTGVGAESRRKSLEELLAEKLAAGRDEVDRGALSELGASYLSQAGAKLEGSTVERPTLPQHEGSEAAA